MIAGVYLTVLGLALLAFPFWEMLRKFGGIDEEALWCWLAEMPLETWGRISATVRVGLAALAFGVFLLVRPR